MDNQDTPQLPFFFAVTFESSSSTFVSFFIIQTHSVKYSLYLSPFLHSISPVCFKVSKPLFPIKYNRNFDYNFLMESVCFCLVSVHIKNSSLFTYHVYGILSLYQPNLISVISCLLYDEIFHHPYIEAKHSFPSL